MNDEDEVLERLMRDKGDNYIMDDGFTKRVMDALPQAHKRKFYASRRTIMILTAAVAGCAIFISLAAPSLPALIQSLSKAIMHIKLATDPISLGCYLIVSLAVASACAFLCLKQNRN